jgi:4-diphosphocytidyl-2-C-methyl-D-erythritol kinase
MDSARALPAPAKLNLFLHVTGRRDDGYHELQTVFVLVDLADWIDVELRSDGEIHRGGDLTGEPDADLALRAALALKHATGCPLGADIAVTKRIPVGSGLGGGSSDAATTLIALNRLWRLDLSRAQLQSIGLALGADVPFFLHGTNAFGQGIGERLESLEIEPRFFAVIWPQVHVPTKEIFADSGLTRDRKVLRMSAFSAAVEPGADARSATSRWVWQPGPMFGANDLEAVARRRVPQVDQALWRLQTHGPARMTGSGSAVFMPSASKETSDAAIAGLPGGWQGWTVRGLTRHPLDAWIDG